MTCSLAGVSATFVAWIFIEARRKATDICRLTRFVASFYWNPAIYIARLSNRLGGNGRAPLTCAGGRDPSAIFPSER